MMRDALKFSEYQDKAPAENNTNLMSVKLGMI